MDKKSKTFLSFIISFGILILGFCIYKILGQVRFIDILYWMLLAGLCQSFLVVFNKDRYVSVVFAIIFAVQLNYGTYHSVIIAAGSQVFFVYKERPQTYRHVFSVPLYKTLFNVANVSISAFISGSILELLSRAYDLNIRMFAFTILMLIYTLSYALLNTGILMSLMSLLNRDSFFRLWFSLMSWILPNFAAIAPFGYLIALLYNQPQGKIYIALLVGPLLLARHSFQLYQNSKELYYKTVKALTAAIEAKDPYTEAHSYIENYLKRHPGIKEYMDRVVEEGKEQGYIKTLMGRRRNLPELSSRNFNTRSFGERVAMNTPIQGTAADIIKKAMNDVYYELKARGLRSKLVLQVHDELIVDTYKPELDEVKEIIRDKMENAMKLCVPLVVDIGVGSSWYDAK
jgi:hypothetical protein